VAVYLLTAVDTDTILSGLGVIQSGRELLMFPWNLPLSIYLSKDGGIKVMY
jgi:hypothetical protein